MIDMKARTKKFTIDCAILCSKLPNSREYNAYVNQLIRCSSSVGANYRASQRAKSSADFINKNQDVINEMNVLLKEGNKILAIVVASIKTVRNNQNSK